MCKVYVIKNNDFFYITQTYCIVNLPDDFGYAKWYYKMAIIRNYFLFNHELPHLSGHAVLMREKRGFRQIPNDKQRVVIAYRMTGMSVVILGVSCGIALTFA